MAIRNSYHTLEEIRQRKDELTVQLNGDADKMGVQYSDIAQVIKGEPVDEEAYEKIMRMHRGSAHKLSIPTYHLEEH